MLHDTALHKFNTDIDTDIDIIMEGNSGFTHYCHFYQVSA